MFRKIASTVNCATNGDKFTMLVRDTFPKTFVKIGLCQNKNTGDFQNGKQEKETWQTA